MYIIVLEGVDPLLELHAQLELLAFVLGEELVSPVLQRSLRRRWCCLCR
jgi:hypothetical protein